MCFIIFAGKGRKGGGNYETNNIADEDEENFKVKGNTVEISCCLTNHSIVFLYEN